MDHMIKEKFIVTDGEKVTDEIYRADAPAYREDRRSQLYSGASDFFV